MNRNNQFRSNQPNIQAAPADKQRLDKWIWFARFLRSRVAAAELIQSGHVRVNGQRVTAPGHFVRIGDVLTLALPSHTIVIRIIAFAPKRGDAAAAKKVYHTFEAAQDGSEPTSSMLHQANN